VQLFEQERNEETKTMACCVDMNKAPVHDWAHFVNLHGRREPFQRDTLSEATVTLRTVVTFVTCLISRTEFLV